MSPRPKRRGPPRVRLVESRGSFGCALVRRGSLGFARDDKEDARGILLGLSRFPDQSLWSTDQSFWYPRQSLLYRFASSIHCCTNGTNPAEKLSKLAKLATSSPFARLRGFAKAT